MRQKNIQYPETVVRETSQAPTSIEQHPQDNGPDTDRLSRRGAEPGGTAKKGKKSSEYKKYYQPITFFNQIAG
jgi:hypothetical protein